MFIWEDKAGVFTVHKIFLCYKLSNRGELFILSKQNIMQHCSKVLCDTMWYKCSLQNTKNVLYELLLNKFIIFPYISCHLE